VASGWHTAVTMMRLIVDGGLPIAVGTGGEMMWTAPVRPGDTLRVTCQAVGQGVARATSFAAFPFH
jgi:acyl dehydratase